MDIWPGHLVIFVYLTFFVKLCNTSLKGSCLDNLTHLNQLKKPCDNWENVVYQTKCQLSEQETSISYWLHGLLKTSYWLLGLLDIRSYWICGQFALDRTVDHITDKNCIWFSDLPTHQVTWKEIQKVSTGLLVVDPHFSL